MLNFAENPQNVNLFFQSMRYQELENQSQHGPERAEMGERHSDYVILSDEERVAGFSAPLRSKVGSRGHLEVATP